MDYNLLKYVYEELYYISREWDQTISDDALRRGSSSLRSLLIEGQLNKAWRMVGLSGKFIIKTQAIENIIDQDNAGKILIAQTGGAKFNNMEIRDVVFQNKTATKEEFDEEFEKGFKQKLKNWSISEYLDSSCFIVQGEKICRRELIQYIANKLGGTHYDTKRDSSDNKESKFLLLDRIFDKIFLADKNAIYFELLSIGQGISGSRSTKILLRRISDLIYKPKHFKAFVKGKQ